jgi:hypothetical protein
MRLDRVNGNEKWESAVRLELAQIDEYVTFKDIGHNGKVKTPEGYKNWSLMSTWWQIVKARLVADGHLTDAPLDFVYSGVVSIRGFAL